MTTTRRILAVVTVLAAAGAEARAQTSRPTSGFLNVNIGAQPAQRSIENSETRSIYAETATISSSLGIKNGPIVDASVGYRIWRNFGFGIGVSHISTTSDGNVVAVIPHPLFFSQLKTLTATQTGLVHTENGIHLLAVWFIPVSTKFDISVSVGPSFIRVTQDIPTVSVPDRTQTIVATTRSEAGTATGANVAFDLNYLFVRHAGVGLFARYAGGKLDLPSAKDLSVGGLQAGIGARFRF